MMRLVLASELRGTMHTKSLPTTCNHCGGADVYTTQIHANGGYETRLLPGLGSLFSFAKFDVVLCASCGHYQMFADRNTRKNVVGNSRWNRLGRGEPEA